MMVNGRVTLFLEVEPRGYRFRILNASNARLYHLLLVNGKPIMQIGTDQGLLASPVEKIFRDGIVSGQQVTVDTRIYSPVSTQTSTRTPIQTPVFNWIKKEN